MTPFPRRPRTMAIGALLAAVAVIAVIAVVRANSESSPPASVTGGEMTLATESQAGTSNTPSPGSDAQPGAGTRIEWQGKEWYLHGVNLPWYNWGCDFGCNSGGGVSSPAVRSALVPRFQQLKDAGIHNVRWWLFPGDPWQISRDASGAPSGINPAVYADIDAALALAETYDLYYTFALFSAPTHLPASWLSDPAQRAQVVAALGSLFAHYAGNPRILAWDVINEPEFDVWSGKVAESDVQALVRDVAARVHRDGGGSLVTVGGAMLDGLPMLAGLGLDFYSPHWYDYMASGDWCARCTDYEAIRAKYDLDAPAVLGEVYTGTDTDSAARFADFYAKGYAGAWGWSLFPERTEDRLDLDFKAAAAFASSESDDGPSR